MSPRLHFTAKRIAYKLRLIGALSEKRKPVSKKISVLVVALALVSVVWYLKPPPESCDMLYGTWRSDKEATLSHVRNNDDISPGIKEFLEKTLGNMTVTFDKTKLVEHEVPKFKITVNQETANWGIEKRTVPYKLVSCGSSSVKIRYNNVFGKLETVKLVFESKDLYRPSSQFASYSEYFRRVSE